MNNLGSTTKLNDNLTTGLVCIYEQNLFGVDRYGISQPPLEIQSWYLTGMNQEPCLDSATSHP